MKPDDYLRHLISQKPFLMAFASWSLYNIIRYMPKFMYAVGILLALVFLLKNYPWRMEQAIAVNNIGYLPHDNKVAMIETEQNPAVCSRFLVVENESLSPVYESQIQCASQKDAETGNYVHIIDFTHVTREGSYYIWIPEKKMRSPLFAISDTVYSGITRQAINSFHFQKCGVEVGANTPWNHTACHLDDAAFYNEPATKKDVTGGWHDAGDYGKFSVTTAFSLGYLLYLFEQNGELFDIQPNLSSSYGNHKPNILQLIKWPMDWLLKMQRADGGVYHKIQKKHWTGEYLPQSDPDKRYIFEVSSTATADFTASTALAARLLESLDPFYAQQLKEAATQSWSFLEKHPQSVPKGGFKNPSGVRGGAYADDVDIDERMWAAVELYRVTGDRKFHAFIEAHFDQYTKYHDEPLTWKNVFPFAVASYLAMPISLRDEKINDQWLNALTIHAQKLVNRTDSFSYRTALKTDEFYWGSNSVAAGYAFSLLAAWEHTGNIIFLQRAADQLHYLLGRNTHNKIFITGQEETFVQHPYHQFSMKLNTDSPVPGFLVGGPNAFHPKSVDGEPTAPAKWYQDSEQSYPSNEVAINYTASFAYLSGYFTNHEYLTYNTNKSN